MIDDLRLQADYCQKTSPLYAALYTHLAALYQDRADGRADPDLQVFFETVDHCWAGRSFTAWFERPLLLAGAIHEQVLQGNAPELSRFYASCGGDFSPSQSEALGNAVSQVLGDRHRHMVPFLSQETIQTNETSRGLAWLLPVLAYWQKARPDITLIELGCSAGLGLVADGYGYRVHGPAERVWAQEGDPNFEVTLGGAGAEQAFASLADMPALSAAITRRIGCDLNPLDCRQENQKRILEALIWPDNAPRLARLRAAIKTQDQYDLCFERGDMVACVKHLSARSFANTPMVVVFNTVASCYLDDDHYTTLCRAIADTFNGPWADKECVWVEFEMPRTGEALPDFAQGQEQLVKVHRPDGKGDLGTHYFGAAMAHPTEIEIFQGA
ncbi:MAG: DUF2332 domain-containing protein [Robiginitomaculum sp.]|nr:DUF2332 domain-containing protein [Robiginitomaculum sp.]MDQ7077677.1 DUF2332 domain-containing protein [Robiginitomaculum sp.]